MLIFSRPYFERGYVAILVCFAAAALTGCPAPTESRAPVPESPQPAATADDVASQSPVEPIRMRDATKEDWFEDVTAKAGVHFSYESGRSANLYTILETVGGGVAVADFDRDGDMDLLFAGGGAMSASPPEIRGASLALFKNEGDWKFSDVTKEAGLDVPLDYSHGCYVADYDRDGYPDLFVTCYGRSRLFRNEEGRRFRDRTEILGEVADTWSTAAAWVDVDSDGWLDLYVTGYLDWKLTADERCGDSRRNLRDVCIPQSYPPSRERLFRNLKGESFVDISRDAGLADRAIGLGAVAADLNQDGFSDIYVGNDVMRNYLYLGDAAGKLREVGVVSGTAVNEYGAPEGSMGVDVGDFDGDEDLDLFVVNYEMEDNSLYRNEGNNYFSHATVRTGLAGVCRPYVGFGTGFADFDSDGWLDLFVINGHVLYRTGVSPYEQPSFIFQNHGGVYKDASSEAAPYFSVPHAGRGAAVGDLDNDGGPDLIIVHQDQPVTVLRNRRAPKHWLGIMLQRGEAGGDLVGATVVMEHAGRNLLRVVRGGGGYLSHFDPRLLFPCENDGKKSIVVNWPGGSSERFKELNTNQYHAIVEGQGEPAQ